MSMYTLPPDVCAKARQLSCRQMTCLLVLQAGWASLHMGVQIPAAGRETGVTVVADSRQGFVDYVAPGASSEAQHLAAQTGRCALVSLLCFVSERHIVCAFANSPVYVRYAHLLTDAVVLATENARRCRHATPARACPFCLLCATPLRR